MDKLFTGAEIKSIDKSTREITAYANRPVLDRDREVIKSDAWVLDEYQKNPVLMLSHQYFGFPDGLPIGKVLWIKKDPEGLKFKARFASSGVSEVADAVWGLYQDDIMRMFSVGFLPMEGGWEDHPEAKAGEPIRTYNKAKLLEISCVAIGSCPDALLDTINGRGIKSKGLIDVVAKVEGMKKKALDLNIKPMKPKDGENKDDFMKRCIPEMIDSGREQDQAAAACYSMWGEKEKEDELILKASRTLSAKSRSMITGAISSIESAAGDLKSYLETVDAKPEEGKNIDGVVAKKKDPETVPPDKDGKCPDGYELSEDKKSCVLKKEEKVVVSVAKATECEPDKEGKCPKGYELSEDGKTCQMKKEFALITFADGETAPVEMSDDGSITWKKPKPETVEPKDGKCPVGYELGSDKMCHILPKKKMEDGEFEFEETGSGELTDDEPVVFKLVDGDEIRDNYDEEFSMGGHHYIYDFIPENEIWIESQMMDEDIVATKAREIVERQLMKYWGMDYEFACDAANVVEHFIRHLTDDTHPGGGVHDPGRHRHNLNHGGNHSHSPDGVTHDYGADYSQAGLAPRTLSGSKGEEKDIEVEEPEVEEIEIEEKGIPKVEDKDMIELDEEVIADKIGKAVVPAVAAATKTLGETMAEAVSTAIRKSMGKAF